jgi:FKBP-type peptidyl-prolyl cis-trans isomerase SlyD
VLDASGEEPFSFIHGQQSIIPGLENALKGMNVGEKKNVVLSPKEGYGEYNPELNFALKLEQFGGQVPEPGMTIQLKAVNGGSFLAQIVSVQDNQVLLDANHPLAGKSLHFDVEITDVREASQEELAHGHAHGPGGHHH